MSPIDALTNQGPLPQSDRNRELQELSLRAFRQALPVEKWLLRDERVDDAGVDVSLELLINRCYTNLRAQVQLKGTDTVRTNNDGTVSLQVATSNLNYLLNGQSPLYILYIAPRNELRFAWARDERKRLDHTNQRWMQQDSVTIRFERLVTMEVLDQIYERIRQEAQLQRRIHDVLGRAGATERVIVSINSDTLVSTDPDEINTLLLASGITIINAGYASQVIDAIDLLNPTDARAPRIQLILGYAEYMLSQNQAALASLTKAMLRRDELSSHDQQFLSYLRDACEFQSGRISLTEYSERKIAWAGQKAGTFALSHRLDSLRYILLSEMDLVRRSEIINEIRMVVNEALVLSDIAESFKLQARLTLLQVEGNQITLNSFEELGQLRIRHAMKRTIDLEAVLLRQRQLFTDWQQRVSQALQDAHAQKHPLLVGDVLLVGATIQVAQITNYHLLAIMFGISLPSPEILDNLRFIAMNNAEQAMKIYGQAGQLEGELRAKLLLADLFMLAEQSSAAQLLARDVLPKVQIMDYAALEVRAQELISGSTLVTRAEAASEQVG